MTSCFEKKLLEEWKADVSVISAVISPCLDLRQLFDFDLREKVLIRTNQRHSKPLFIACCNEEDVRANYFTKRVAPVWNGLTEEIVDALSPVWIALRRDWMCCGMITQ